MTSLETAIITPLLIVLILIQVIGLSFFFIAQIQTAESLTDFYRDSGDELFEYAEIIGLRAGPLERAPSFQQLRTSGWELLRWGVVASDLTRMLTGRVLP